VRETYPGFKKHLRDLREGGEPEIHERVVYVRGRRSESVGRPTSWSDVALLAGFSG